MANARAILEMLQDAELAARQTWEDIILNDDDLSEGERRRIAVELLTDKPSEDVRMDAVQCFIHGLVDLDELDAASWDELRAIDEWIYRMFDSGQ